MNGLAARRGTPEVKAGESGRETPRLTLLGGFAVYSGAEQIFIPTSGQRLIAFLALQRRSMRRAAVAGSLWSETTDDRACANLRTTLWNLHRSGLGVVDAGRDHLGLSSHVLVDIDEMTALGQRIIDFDRSKSMHPRELTRLVSRFESDLLPDWYEDWIVIERERFLQVRLHALEVICELLLRLGRFAEALEAGLAAVAGDPIRESAHRAVIRVHLEEGNIGETLRQYQLCQRFLADFGLEPSCQTSDLVERHRYAARG